LIFFCNNSLHKSPILVIFCPIGWTSSPEGTHKGKLRQFSGYGVKGSAPKSGHSSARAKTWFRKCPKPFNWTKKKLCYRHRHF